MNTLNKPTAIVNKVAAITEAGPLTSCGCAYQNPTPISVCGLSCHV